jgi:hypothetical protein
VQQHKTVVTLWQVYADAGKKQQDLVLLPLLVMFTFASRTQKHAHLQQDVTVCHIPSSALQASTDSTTAGHGHFG